MLLIAIQLSFKILFILFERQRHREQEKERALPSLLVARDVLMNSAWVFHAADRDLDI